MQNLNDGEILEVGRLVEKSCGHIADADIDAAIVIRQRGLTELGIKLQIREVIPKFTPKDSLKINSEREHQQQYVEPGKHRSS